MRPFAQSDGHDGLRLIDELVPGVASVIEWAFGGGEDSIGEPVVVHELPDVLDRVQCRTLRRQGRDGDVAGHDEVT